MSKTISVPIAGIDRATPDHIVQDGKCETLTNLRYRNGAWRNIKPPKQKVEIVGGSIKVGKEIHYGNAPVLLYKHPQADGNKYIAALNDLNTMNTYDARICSISLATNDIAEIYDTTEELITHTITPLSKLTSRVYLPAPDTFAQASQALCFPSPDESFISLMNWVTSSSIPTASCLRRPFFLLSYAIVL